ncbi:MAG TPA: hypothetical protein GX497_06330 [Bacillus bacterium]|nr:hypothetical protein [Bacillus sp. (in: firmicutes)]
MSKNRKIWPTLNRKNHVRQLFCNNLNEKGSSLVLVLLISLIFSVLGLAVLGASINNVKRTEIRELDIDTTLSAKVIISEVLVKLQENIDKNGPIKDMLKKEKPSDSGTNYDVQLYIEKTDTENAFSSPDYEVKIEEGNYGDYNITDEISFKKDNYLRVFKITVTYKGTEANNPTIERKATQNVILSPTPSFLNYAVGAYGKESGTTNNIKDDFGNPLSALVINGSPDIIGNVFAPTLELHSRAKYIDIDAITGMPKPPDETGLFHGPSIFGTLYTTKVINKRESTPEKAPFYEGVFKEKDDGIKGIPVIKSVGSNFVDMSFPETFSLKWTESGAPPISLKADGTLDENPSYSDLDCSGYSTSSFYNALIETDALVENYRSPSSEFTYISAIITGDENIRTNELSDMFQNPKFTCKHNEKPTEKKLFLLEESMLETYNGNNYYLFTKDINGTSNTLFFTNIDKKTEGGAPELLNKYKKNASADETDNILKLTKYLPTDGLLLKNDDNHEKGWLVINGSLEINGGSEDNPVIIKGNILVNGDLYIKSDSGNKEFINFDATIYVTGTTMIDNVNIDGALDDPTDDPLDPNSKRKQLVLISNGELKIVRINEYDDVDYSVAPFSKELVTLINEKPNLKGFFYTDKNATLYGVGSHFQIEGGVFAREQLIINAIRYNFNPKNEGAINQAKNLAYFDHPDSKGKRSRFYVEYDNRVITDQLSSLPRVNRLQVIADDLVVK